MGHKKITEITLTHYSNGFTKIYQTKGGNGGIYLSMADAFLRFAIKKIKEETCQFNHVPFCEKVFSCFNEKAKKEGD